MVEFFDEHDEHTSTVTFGPTIGDFFVFNQKTWQYEGRGLNLPDWLSDDNRQIKQVALGMNGAHCILFTNGEWTVACENNYPELYDILNDHERGDVVVSKATTLKLDTLMLLVCRHEPQPQERILPCSS